MTKSTRTIIVAAALAGLYAGSLAVKASGQTSTPSPGAAAPAGDDKAKDSCKGKDGCKAKDAKDSCKGKDGCKSKDAKDSCKGKDGCKAKDAKDSCKAKDEKEPAK